MQDVGLGELKLFIRGKKHYTVYGGPYLQKPVPMKGLKLAAEIKAECDISIPTQDFSVPNKEDLDKGLREAVNLILGGHPLYIGCKGGMGRTGLFLSILAKAFKQRSPVPYVRKKYYRGAVETKEQYVFVTKYKIPKDVAKKIRWYRFWAFLRLTNTLTKPVTQTNVEYAGSLLKGYSTGGTVTGRASANVAPYLPGEREEKLDFSKTSNKMLAEVFKPGEVWERGNPD